MENKLNSARTAFGNIVLARIQAKQVLEKQIDQKELKSSVELAKENLAKLKDTLQDIKKDLREYCVQLARHQGRLEGLSLTAFQMTMNPEDKVVKLLKELKDAIQQPDKKDEVEQLMSQLEAIADQGVKLDTPVRENKKLSEVIKEEFKDAGILPRLQALFKPIQQTSKAGQGR